ncbi:MAG: toll/interleukin-1 receptor domain-containing protein [Pirellulales bacterium]|nr:toll/interleukin-1 receptor domain-containing protein [Pirellulales bacterium]
MSTQTATTYDVFLSYPLSETAVAGSVANALKQVGLDVFGLDRIEAGENWRDVVWKALAESSAMIAIVPSEGILSSSVAVEVGAFRAWQKPIYIIQAGRGDLKLPAYLASFPVYPLSRVDDIVESIQRGLESFSEDDRKTLAIIYCELGIPTDQLLGNPACIDQLATEFEARTRKKVPGGQLVRELLNLRKSGDLPRIQKVKKGQVK